MIIGKSVLSVFGVLALTACSAASDRGSGLGDTAGGASNGSAGSNIGSGLSSSSAGGTNLNVSNGGTPGGGDVMNGQCDQQAFNLSQKPAEILILLDRSASMQDPPSGSSGTSKWDLVVPGVNEVVTATNTSVSWGLKTFPELEGKSCIATSVTNAIPVAIAATNATAVTTAITMTTPKGNGTPTGDAVRAAVTYLKTLTDPNPKYILLATDGEPSCANGAENSTAARTLAVQAVGEAAAAGFKTFVVGVATTKDTATQALNDMAVAGQMPRMTTNPLGTKYYLASTKDELVLSLQQITGQVASCAFHLTKKPPDVSNIAVKVNGVKAPPDTTHMNGWDYTDATSQEVTVYGSWCDQIKASPVNTVNFILGCPGEIIP